MEHDCTYLKVRSYIPLLLPWVCVCVCVCMCVCVCVCVCAHKCMM